MANRFFFGIVMIINLHQQFLALSDVDLRMHGALLERLLYCHLRKEHLFCLTPAQIAKLRGAVQFGPQAQQVLATILRKSQEYLAHARKVDSRMVVVPIGAELPVDTETFKHVEAGKIDEWLHNPPRLFVEHGVNDGNLYKLIISNALRLLGFSEDLVSITPFHGGGATLAQVIDDFNKQKTVGLCICDRDTCGKVPPLLAGKTATAAAESFRALGSLSVDGVTISSSHPFFTFAITHGWGLENYIGPNLAGLYFDENPETQEQRASYLKIYPDREAIDEEGVRRWMLVNLKTSNQDHNDIISSFSSRFGANLPTSIAKSLASIMLPTSAHAWIRSQWKSGRFSAAISREFENDCKFQEYSNSLTPIALASLRAFSADRRMNFA